MNPNPQPRESDTLTPGENVDGGHVEADKGSDYLITVQLEPQYEDRLDADRLHKLACDVLETEKVPGPLELGVVITTDEEVRALNVQYLGHDYNTDVISFGMEEEEEVDGAPAFVTPAERPAYLGDIAISYDRAAEQAPDYGHSTDAEVAMLLIHGILHLLGYDDTVEDKRAEMHARQQELLDTLYTREK